MNLMLKQEVARNVELLHHLTFVPTRGWHGKRLKLSLLRKKTFRSEFMIIKSTISNDSTIILLGPIKKTVHKRHVMLWFTISTFEWVSISLLCKSSPFEVGHWSLLDHPKQLKVTMIAKVIILWRILSSNQQIFCLHPQLNFTKYLTIRKKGKNKHINI